MKIAITGGTGFVGRHLARALVEDGHEAVLIARGRDRRDESVRQLPHASIVPADITDGIALGDAFAGCEGVAHLAGIDRERGRQTYARVHVEGTLCVVEAAKQAGVKKIVLLSFLRARPGCSSPYHESKWAAEEIVRGSGLDFTILKAGVIYGRGDLMLANLSRSLRIFPVFPLVGMKERRVRPVAVEDVVRILRACLVEGRLSRETVSLVGPEVMAVSEMIRRVARVSGKRPVLLPIPVFLNSLAAWVFERLMPTPLVSLSQVRMLAEGIAEPLPGCDPVPEDLAPRILFTADEIRRGLPDTDSAGTGERSVAGPRQSE